jgi:hypothetical protein
MMRVTAAPLPDNRERLFRRHDDSEPEWVTPELAPPPVVGGFQDVQQFAQSTRANGVSSCGAIQGSGAMTPLHREHLREQFKRFAGKQSAAKA